MNYDFNFKLGTKVRDVVTRVEGIIISRTQWLTGCNTYGLQRELKQSGEVGDIVYTDENRIESLDEFIRLPADLKKKQKETKQGGPATFIPDPAQRAPRG